MRLDGNNAGAPCGKPIRAELSRDDGAAALNITVKSSSPVLALCRKLIEARHDTSAPLEAYRGGTLALRVKSIGHAVGLEVNGDGTGFRPARKPDRGPLVRLNQRGGEYACPRANSAQGIGGPNASR